MHWRLRGYECCLALGGFMLALGTAPGLRAQEGAPPAVQESEPKPAEVADEPTDAQRELETPDVAAPDKGAAGSSILDLDIEQLGKVQAKVPTAFDAVVTSVTSNKSTIGKSAAAVFVITNEMIRRSGATSVPETLRMVPGLQVAKIGSSKWAISSRGFNEQFSRKLLVLVDGRTVYNPLTGGVYWDTQDLVLQDVERIEVIRGPGATVWGANAVNGVISIITKTAGNTQGALVSGGGGDQDRAINAVRIGGQIGDNARYRVYAKQTDRAAGFNPDGAGDAWRTVRGGFRIDYDDPDQQDQLTLQGDLFAGVVGESTAIALPTPPFFQDLLNQSHIGGGNVLGRWTHVVDEDNSYSIQTYYDRTARSDIQFNLAINTYDTQFHQNLKHSGTHMFTWGGGYRLMIDNITPSVPLTGIDPQSRTFDQANTFFQEEMPLFRDDLKLIVGSKFLFYYFTGFEYQPSVRLLWEIDEKQVIWGAVSRAVRTPTRFEEDAANIFLASPSPPVFFQFNGGGRALKSEDLLAYELGYRRQVNDKLSFELATFYNVYRNLIENPIIGVIPGTPTVLVSQFGNVQNAQTYGFELNGQWEIHEKWRIRGWYSFLRMLVYGIDGDEVPGQSPRNQAYLMSSWDLPYKFEFDLMSRYVENLPTIDVPAYTSLDARLGWRPKANWEFSVIGQNLLSPHHLEFVGQTTALSAVNRGVYAQVVWRH